MKVIVISHPESLRHEPELITRLFDEGLECFHLRKPEISKFSLIRLLKKIPEQYHNRIVIHDNYELINNFHLKGIHFNKKTISLLDEYKNAECSKSYSAHSVSELRKYDSDFDYMFISPVFDSISKGNYHKQIDFDELKKYISEENPASEIIALGGINEYNYREALNTGVHGVALLGNIWKTYLENNDFTTSLESYRLIQNSDGKHRPYVLTIAGFDPCGGAGLNADLKTFENHKVYGLSVCTSLTYQNEDEFVAVNWISFENIVRQIDILLNKYQITFVKIGLIENLSVLNNIIDYLKSKNPLIKIVWDPILASGTGFNFHLSPDNSLINEILTKVFMLTPNFIESEILFKQFGGIKEYVKSHKTIVLIKGGHRKSENNFDELYQSDKLTIFNGENFRALGKHGTGCVLSSSVLANLALGESIEESCRKAKRYVEKFMQSNKGKLGYHK